MDAIRSDIRDGREGTRLELALRVRSAGACEPIENVVVDLCHCDAGGADSGFGSAEGERFLRGAQVTNADGIAKVTTSHKGNKRTPILLPLRDPCRIWRVEWADARRSPTRRPRRRGRVRRHLCVQLVAERLKRGQADEALDQPQRAAMQSRTWRRSLPSASP